MVVKLLYTIFYKKFSYQNPSYIYKSIIHSCTEYYCLIWSDMPATYLKNLNNIQRRVYDALANREKETILNWKPWRPETSHSISLEYMAIRRKKRNLWRAIIVYVMKKHGILKINTLPSIHLFTIAMCSSGEKLFSFGFTRLLNEKATRGNEKEQVGFLLLMIYSWQYSVRVDIFISMT